MHNYKRGYNFEIRVRDKFRECGFQAERKAASAPYDLIVMKDGRVVFLVDSKKTAQRDRDYLYVRKGSVESIIGEAEKVKAEPLIAYGFYRTPIYIEPASNIIDEGSKTVRLESSLELTDFLENFEMEQI